jgi:hypothetical protein
MTEAQYKEVAERAGWNEVAYDRSFKRDMTFQDRDGMKWGANSWKELCEDFTLEA